MQIFVTGAATESQREVAREVLTYLLLGDVAAASDRLSASVGGLEGKTLTAFAKEAAGVRRALFSAADRLADTIATHPAVRTIPAVPTIPVLPADSTTDTAPAADKPPAAKKPAAKKPAAVAGAK